MEKESNYCYRCRYLDRYYVKGIKRFNKTKIGRCIKSGDTVNVRETCGLFEESPKRSSGKLLIRYCLNDLLTQLSEIRKIIEEEKDEQGGDEEV